MKTVVALALAAGRKHQSSQTGYLHFQDLIPLYENLCFVLALFRSHLSDQVLEGKALLEKIFHFECDGHFPVHLHEFPVCRDPYLSQKIQPIFFWLQRDFGPLLGAYLREKVSHFLERTPLLVLSHEPVSPEEWAQSLMVAQMKGDRDTISRAIQRWHPLLQAFMGQQTHGGAEPAVTLLDLFMGELYGEFSKRALQPHLSHLRGALVQPFSFIPNRPEPAPYIYSEEQGLFIGWGSRECLHTCVTFQEFMKEGEEYVLRLPPQVPQENDNEEVVFYCNAHPEHRIFVNGKKATSFQLGDTVQIISRDLTLEFSFEAEGLFSGFIARALRPRQPKINQFVAYDWKIGLRTLRRNPQCAVVCKLRLSAASPMILRP